MPADIECSTNFLQTDAQSEKIYNIIYQSD